MTKRDTAPAGAPCWLELYTSDPDAAKRFYGELFGWTHEDGGEELGGYISFFKDGLRVAGGMRNDGTAGTPDAWTIYLASTDAQVTADAAGAHGGQVVVPPMAVADLGTMAVVVDPGQAAIGIWQPGTHTGFQVWQEPGTPSWFELHPRAYDAAVGFYRDVFGWDTYVAADEPDFRYTTLGEGDDGLAGVMDASGFLPEGVPGFWSVYFDVEDIAATLSRVVELGGTMVRPAEETPYGHLAEAADTTGTSFKVRQT
jgi:uncharacterized protein